MPIYEFQCQDCGRKSEKWWHLYEESSAVVVCLHCSGRAKRVPSIPAFHTEEIDSETGMLVFKGDPLEGTPFEGDDGVNPLQYDESIQSGEKDAKIQVDLGK